MSYDKPNQNQQSDSNSVNNAHNKTAAQIKKELDEKTVDPKQDLVYNQRTPQNPRELINNPAVVPETFDDSQNPRSDLRHDDE